MNNRFLKILAVLLCLLPAVSGAADNFVQQNSGSAGATTCSATLTSVVAGNTIVAYLFNGGSTSGGITGVADAQGAYTSKGPAPADAVDAVVGQTFVLQSATSGTHAITGTVTNTACEIFVVELGTTAGASAFSGANGAFQSSPGTGTDAVSSGSATITGAATLLAFSVNTPVGNVPADEPAVGTGFTSRASGADNVIGAWRLSSKAASSSAAGTFTAASGQGASSYITFGTGILNATVTATPASGIFVTLP